MGLSVGSWVLLLAAGGVGLAIEIPFYRAQKRRGRREEEAR